MGAAVDLLSDEWPACIVPSGPVPRELANSVRARMGAVPGWLPRVAPCPWLVDTMVTLIGKPVAALPPDLVDRIDLVVSQDNSCRYCYGVQRAVLRIRGYTDADIERLVRDAQTGDGVPAERAAIDFARRLSRADPRPGPAEFERLLASGLERLAAIEVACAAATGNFANRVATLLALPTESLEKFVRHPLFRVIRPLMSWRMRPRLRPREPLPDPNTGFGARVVAALDGSPAAGVLRRTIDAALGSPILPARTKVLVIAVVARALGCREGERDTRTLLAREGFAAADMDQILDTLASPKLDAREARLVPFARETVRYQPATIQLRMRDVCRDLGPAETLEVAGILALANAICRLSVVLDAC
ncbi:MAG TPA: carboxymuconolactone decarboxylase family protein [Candidatus Binatia bacterium]|nr:carboxymuconolactone decarboxylase family protein [Candidatus Binatia bacterium]